MTSPSANYNAHPVIPKLSSQGESGGLGSSLDKEAALSSAGSNGIHQPASTLKPGRPRAVAGITLLETVIGLGVFLLVAVAILAFGKDFFQLNRLVSGGLDRETEVRKVFKNFVAEVRSASPSSLGGYLIEQASASSFTFFSDIDGDGLKERTRYFLDGATLKKGIIKPTGTPLSYVPANETVSSIVESITGPAATFSYYGATYDGTGSPLADPPNIQAIRMVRVTLAVDPNGDRPPGATTFTTQATIRNLKASD